MRKILIAIMAGLLLIGAASANYWYKPTGKAMSCADAFAIGKAKVDFDLVGEQTNKLVTSTQAFTLTWQVDDAKVDPIAATFSTGYATSKIDGTVNVDDDCNWGFGCWNNDETADVKITAESGASAYQAARGSEIAVGSSDTFNMANTWANDCSLGSLSIASSESSGFAKGHPAFGADITDITDLYPDEENGNGGTS